LKPLASSGSGSILIDPISPDIAIVGDSVLCYNSSATYVTDWNGTVSWGINGNFFSNAPSITVNASDLTPTTLLTATLENTCQNLTVSFEITVHEQQNLVPSFYDTLVCPNSDVLVNFTGFFPEIFTLDYMMIGLNNIINVQVNDQPITYYFYALDSNGCLSDTVGVNFDVILSIINIEEIYMPLCTPDTLILTTNVNTLVTWELYPDSFVADTLFLPILNAGEFTITAHHIDSNGCPVWDFSNVAIFNPNEYLLPDTMVCIGETVYTAFAAEIMNGVLTFVPTDSIQITSSIAVSYTVTNNYGCPFTGEIQVEAINCQADFPNVITPNGDGVKDVFVIRTALMEPNNHLIILNRWGNVVFEESGYKNTFSGAHCVDGVYFYQYNPNSLKADSSIVKGFLHIFNGQ
jgi:gliding motility-associated-like protein